MAGENPIETILLATAAQEMLGEDDGMDIDYGEGYEGDVSWEDRYASGGSAVFPTTPSPTGREFNYFPNERIG